MRYPAALVVYPIYYILLYCMMDAVIELEAVDNHELALQSS